MKVEVSQATGSISDYAKQARKETVLLTRAGKPVAAVVALDEDDWEDFALSTNPEFLAVLERSRARWREEGGLTSDEVRKRLGLPPRRVGPKKRAARPHTSAKR